MRAQLYPPLNNGDGYNDEGGRQHGLLVDGLPTLFVGPNLRLN
jgi:hypothetical protein